MVTTYTAKADSFAADKPRLWSNTQILEPIRGGAWDLDLAPDGKRFAVFPRPDATVGQKGSVHVTVLLNFFDELRRRGSAGKSFGRRVGGFRSPSKLPKRILPSYTT